jgi:hypothetical protein
MTTDIAPARANQPHILRRLWDGWKRLGRRLGDFQARLLLTVFYFTAITPFALVVRCATDPLSLKSRTPRGWRPRPAVQGGPLERARRQF